MNSRSRLLVASLLTSVACAAARPPLAAAWCESESDRVCGQRYAALFEKFDLYAADDGNRDGMLQWFSYRCALDTSSQTAADTSNDVGLDCWRAGMISLAAGNLRTARSLNERGCEAWGWADACAMAAAFSREKFELRAAHDFECRAQKAVSLGQRSSAQLEGIDCMPGADTVSKLRAAEAARASQPARPANALDCALRGCTLPNGRAIKPWIDGW